MATYPLAYPPAAGYPGAGNGNRGGGSTGGGHGDGFHGSGPREKVPQRAYITGMMIAIAAIFMFFVALVSAFVVRKGFPDNDWRAFAVPKILWLNTIILAVSSFALARSRMGLRTGRKLSFRVWWSATAFLGIAFLVGQFIAWRQLASTGVYLTSNPSSSFFYVFTAVHGIHLLGGIAGLLGIRFARPGRLTMDTATRVVSIYWHFLDVLWLCLFVLLLFGQ